MMDALCAVYLDIVPINAVTQVRKTKNAEDSVISETNISGKPRYVRDTYEKEFRLELLPLMRWNTLVKSKLLFNAAGNEQHTP